MLTLKNLKMIDGYLEADYFPSENREVGHIKIDCKTLQVVEEKVTSVDGVTKQYFAHARAKMKELIQERVTGFEEEIVVAWY